MSRIPLGNLKENRLGMSRIPSKIPRTSSQRTNVARPAHFDVGQALSQMKGMERQEEREEQEILAELDRQIDRLREEVSAMEVLETEHFRRLHGFEREKENLTRKLGELSELIESFKRQTEAQLKHKQAELDLKLEKHKLHLKEVLDAAVSEMQDQISEAEKDEGSQELKDKIKQITVKIPVLQKELLERRREMSDNLRREKERKDAELDVKLAKIREITTEPKAILYKVKGELSSVEDEIARFRTEIEREESKQKSLKEKIQDTSVGDSMEDNMRKLELKKRQLEDEISAQSAELHKSKELESVKRRHFETRCGELELERKHIRQIEHQIFELRKKRRVIARVVGCPLKYYRIVPDPPYTLIESTISRTEPLCFEKVIVSDSSSDTAYIKEYELLVRDCAAGESLAVINTGTEMPDMQTLLIIAKSYLHSLQGTDIRLSVFRYAIFPDGVLDTISGRMTPDFLVNGRLDFSSLKKVPVSSDGDLDEAFSKMDDYADESTIFGFYVSRNGTHNVLLHLDQGPGSSDAVSQLIELLYASMKTQTIVCVPDSDDISIQQCLVSASSLRSESASVNSSYIV